MLTTFIYNHIVEIIGLIFGICYVIGAVFNKWWCWPASLLAIAAYGYSTYQMQLYGEFSLQFFYFALTIYGWHKWTRGENEIDNITKSSLKLLYKILVISILISIVFYYLLVHLDGSFPFWDAVTNGFAITATYLVARRKIENWLMWVPIDLVLMTLMFYRGMPFYGVLYLVYTLFALWGYIQWRRQLQ